MFWQYAESTRNGEKSDIVDKLFSILDSVTDSCKLYVPVKAGTVRECFESTKDTLPANMFRRKIEGETEDKQISQKIEG